MKIDVIIGLYKEPKYITQCLKSLPRKTEGYELNTILVEDNSPYSSQLKLHTSLSGHENYLSLPDPTYEDIEFFVRQLTEKSMDIGFIPMASFYRSHQTKQFGLIHSDADVVCFSDEDVFFPEDFFPKIHQLFSKYENIIVFGNLHRWKQKEDYKWQVFEEQEDWSTLDNIKRKNSELMCDCVFAVRRDLMIRSGGYPNFIGYGADKEVAIRQLVKEGGFLTLFKDLKYYHIEHEKFHYLMQNNVSDIYPELYNTELPVNNLIKIK